MVWNLGGLGDYGKETSGWGSDVFGGKGSSLKDDYDWGGFSKGTDWGGGFSAAKEKPSFLENWLSGVKESESEGKYRRKAERGGGGVYGGEWNKPFGGQVLENLGVVYPQQYSPMFIPGLEGQKGTTGSQIGRFAGAALGAALGGPVGASLGGMAGGMAGGFFD